MNGRTQGSGFWGRVAYRLRSDVLPTLLMLVAMALVMLLVDTLTPQRRQQGSAGPAADNPCRPGEAATVCLMPAPSFPWNSEFPARK